MRKLISVWMFSLILSCSYVDYPCVGTVSGKKHQLRQVETKEINGDSVAIFHCFRIDGYDRRVCPFRDTITFHKRR